MTLSMIKKLVQVCVSVHFKIKMYPTILGVGGQAKKESKEDDLQILQEIPGKSGLPGNMSSLQSLLGAAASGGGSGGAGAFFNPPSILQAQDPFFNLAAMQAGGSSSANTLDLLQKCKFFIFKTLITVFKKALKKSHFINIASEASNE